MNYSRGDKAQIFGNTVYFAVYGTVLQEYLFTPLVEEMSFSE